MPHNQDCVAGEVVLNRRCRVNGRGEHNACDKRGSKETPLSWEKGHFTIVTERTLLRV